MKKNVFFAYMAAVVFGLMTIVSCTNDDEDDGSATFAWQFEIGTKNAQIEQNELFQRIVASSEESVAKSLDKVETTSQAEAAWAKYTSEKEVAEMMVKLNRMAQQFKDPTMYCTLSILRNGKVWKTQTWTTTYDPSKDVQEHVYRLGVTVNTSYDEIRNSDVFQNLVTQMKTQVEEIQIPFFDEESALAEWNKQIIDNADGYQQLADQAGKAFGDDSFSITISLLCDEEVLQTKTWKTSYKK